MGSIAPANIIIMVTAIVVCVVVVVIFCRWKE